MRLKSRTPQILLALAAVATVACGATYTATTDTGIASTWTGPEEPEGAPSAQIDATTAQALTEARRAAGEAAAQAGFLDTGVQELKGGIGQLSSRSGEIIDGAAQLHDGAEQLNQGLIQLQAGTGQLGNGATQVADGVAQAVEQVQAVAVIQSQVLGAMDQADKELARSQDPDIVNLRGQLKELRTQAEQFGIDGELADKLDQLRSGSREVANQLAVPGYGYHDGIYKAAQGAKQLSEATGELDSVAKQATDGIGQLDQGATKIADMSAKNLDAVAGVQRALPRTSATPATSTSGNNSDDAAPAERGSLPPLYAVLIAAATLLGATLTRINAKKDWWQVLAISTTATVTYAILAGTVTAAGVIQAWVLLTVAAYGVTAGTQWARRALGPAVGMPLIFATVAAQIGVVTWAWKQSTAVELSRGWEIVNALMPVNYPALGLSTLGNDGPVAPMLLSLAVVGVLAVCTVVGNGLSQRAALRDTHVALPKSELESEEV